MSPWVGVRVGAAWAFGLWCLAMAAAAIVAVWWP